MSVLNCDPAKTRRNKLSMITANELFTVIYSRNTVPLELVTGAILPAQKILKGTCCKRTKDFPSPYF